jgi:hypothetical protein
MASGPTPILRTNADGTVTNQSGVTFSGGGGAVIPTLPAAPVDASALGGTTPFTLPPAPAPSTFDISTLPSIGDLLNPPKSQVETDLDSQEQLLATDSAKIGGKAAAQISAEDTAARSLGATTGLADFTKQLRDINAQQTQLTADAAAATNKSEDRLAPTFAIRGEQAQIERQRSVRALGLSAIAQTLQGNIASAQDYATRAVEVQFAPVQAEIDYLKSAIDINKDKLSREDAKRAEALQVQLQERQRVLDEQKADKEGVHQIAMTAAQFGAPANVLNGILSSDDVSSAIGAAGAYLQDPKAQYELESAKLDVATKKAQLAKLTEPSKDEQAAVEKAKAAIPVAQDKLKLIDSLINSAGLAGAVGPNPLARSAVDFNFFTGVRQDFIAGVNQLTNQDTLDALLNLKAQGGSLGALSDSEGALLRQAASKIGSWAIHDGSGNVVGFNTTDASMKAELQTIRNLTQRALENAASSAGLVTPDEKNALQSFLTAPSTTSSTPAVINPAAYF